MPLWLGNPGGVVQLPSPHRGMTPTLIRPHSARATIGGGQVISRAPGPGRRTYSPTWPYLSEASFSILEEFFTGARGDGPHALLDSGRRNVLMANQSSATAVDRGTSGFSVAVGSGELLASTAELLHGDATRSLRWSLPDVATAGVLALDPPTGIAGVPAPTGRPWTFSAQVAGGGVDPVVSVAAALRWLTPAGVVVDTTVGAPVTLTPGVFSPVSVTASTPVGACVRPLLLADVTTVSAVAEGPGDVPVRRGPWTMPVKRAAATGPLPRPMNTFRPDGATAADVYVAALMLDMYASVRAWALGTGVPRVTVVELPESYNVLPDRACTAVLVEVG